MKTQIALVALFTLFAEVSAQKYTQWPIQPIYKADEIRKGDTALVFVYSCLCPRSQQTIDELQKAADMLRDYYGLKVKSLEYYQTGYEIFKVQDPIYRFPVLTMYRSDGSKVKYHGVDPPYASSDDFVRFALDNEYSYGSDYRK